MVGAPRLHFYASPATLRRVAQILKKDLGTTNLFDPDVSEKPLKRLDEEREHVISATTMNCGADSIFHGN